MTTQRERSIYFYNQIALEVEKENDMELFEIVSASYLGEEKKDQKVDVKDFLLASNLFAKNLLESQEKNNSFDLPLVINW